MTLRYRIGVQSNVVILLPSDGRGKWTCSALSAKCTCRALPSSRKRWKIPRVASWMRQSGSRPRPTSRCQTKPIGNPEFTSESLGPRGRQPARAQDTKFKFADAAVHSQKQSVIRPTRIVDAIEVDDAAQLEQMMPVPAVAGEAGRVESVNAGEKMHRHAGAKLHR